MNEKTEDLIAEARVHVPYAGSQDDNWCIHCADDWPCVTRRLADALEAATSERDAALAAIERVKVILDRDDFGDSWEHDEWVFREAAEKKLGEIEAALDGAPEPEEKP